MAKEQHFVHPPRGHVAILAYDDGNDRWQVLECTADGYLEIRLQEVNGTVPVQQATPALLQPGINTYDGSVWHKQAPIWGFTDRYHETEYTTDSAGGTHTFTFSTVPAGEVWVITGVSIVNQNNVWTGNVDAFFGAGIATVKAWYGGVAGQWQTWDPVHLVLKADDHVKAYIQSTVLHDDLYCNMWGYKMAIDM